MQTELKMKKWIQIPPQRIQITQCHLQSKAKKNITDSNPLKLDSNPFKLDSNPLLGNNIFRVRDSNPFHTDSNPQD